MDRTLDGIGPDIGGTPETLGCTERYEFEVGDRVVIRSDALNSTFKDEDEYQRHRLHEGLVIGLTGGFRSGGFIEVLWPNEDAKVGGMLFLASELSRVRDDKQAIYPGFDPDKHVEAPCTCKGMQIYDKVCSTKHDDRRPCDYIPGGFEQEANADKLAAAFAAKSEEERRMKIGGFSEIDRKVVGDAGWAALKGGLKLQELHPHGHPRFTELLTEFAELHSNKNFDYARGGDPLGNFKRCADILGTTPAQFAWSLVYKQIDAVTHAFKQGGEQKVESVRDKLRDIAVYATLMIIMLEEA